MLLQACRADDANRIKIKSFAFFMIKSPGFLIYAVFEKAILRSLTRFFVSGSLIFAHDGINGFASSSSSGE